MIYKSIVAIIIVVVLVNAASAQTRYKTSQFKKYPVWIDMMNDTSANYFETIKAFRTYYKDRVLPREANEIAGEDTFEREVGLEDESHDSQKSEKERERELQKLNSKEVIYTAEVRAFKGWFYSIKPWVRSDGSIVGPKEQQAIIDGQHNELKQIESANNKHK